MSGPLPTRWTSEAPVSVPEGAVTGWLADFGDPRLRELVMEAVSGNYDLAAGAARIDQAQERARIAGADRLPRLDSSHRTSRSQSARGAAFQNTRANNFSLSVDLSWEVDLWGRVKNLRDAELDRLGAEANLYEAARLSLAANVAKTLFEAVELRQQIDLTRRNLRSLRTNLEILDARLDAGDADDRTALEISLSRADVARAESNLLASSQRQDGAKRTLETLLGRYPEGAIEISDRFPAMRREVPAGLPSELLLRRPDLLAAEARVDALFKEVSASRKALLPSFGITGNVGTFSTREFSDILDLNRLVWGIGYNLSRPLYQGGRLRANIRLDEARRDELVASYAETALVAFREVEAALAAERYLTGQRRALTTAATEARRAETLSLSQYEEGLVEIITLLESQRRSFDAQSALLGIEFELLRNRVDLYLALGGDFDHPLVEK